MTAGPRERAGFKLAPDDGICNGTEVRFQNKKKLIKEALERIIPNAK